MFFSFISPSTVYPCSPILMFTCFPTLTQTSRIPTTFYSFHSVTFFLRILHSFTLRKLLGKLLFLNHVQKPEIFRKLFAFFISFIEKRKTYNLRCTNKYAYITFDDVFSFFSFFYKYLHHFLLYCNHSYCILIDKSFQFFDLYNIFLFYIDHKV